MKTIFSLQTGIATLLCTAALAAGFVLFLIFIEAQPFLKNATATTPGPVCVPMTLQMSVESSESALLCQMSQLSSTYFLKFI